MEITNAFAGHTLAPTTQEVETALGPALGMWTELVEWAHRHGAPEEEWRSPSPRSGWSLRLKNKTRNVLYLSPCRGCIRVSLILSDQALATAKATHLSRAAQEALEQAPHFAEGNGVQLMVRNHGDLAVVAKIAAIKLAN